MNFKKILSAGLALGVFIGNTYALDISSEDLAYNLMPIEESVSISAPTTTSSEEFVVSKNVAFSMFLRGLATPAVEDSDEVENMANLMELGVQARACLSCDDTEVAEDEPVSESNSNISGNFYLPECPLDADLQQYIYDMAISKDIPVDMMFTVPLHESGYDINALSATDDYGLYQINICNHKGYSKMCGTENKPYDPYINTLWAATMISNYLRQFGEKYSSYEDVVDWTLSCYNGGPGSKLRPTYISRYDSAHAKVEQWMKNAGYGDMIKAW